MALNDTTQKLDTQLDTACKKLEKICFDTGSTELVFNDEASGKSMGYLEYIKTFAWNVRGFSTKRSLLELTGICQKKMKDTDEKMKNHLESHTNIKNKLSAFSKKEGGNLMVRDFTDDLYNLPIPEEIFVEKFGSDMFSNLLVVVPKTKIDVFKTECLTLMEDYYALVDAQEDKRVPDLAKLRLTELKEKHHGTEEWIKLIDLVGVLEDSEEFETRAREVLRHEITNKHKAKRAKRMPVGIVPGATAYVGLEDRDGNQVYRVVVYASQGDEVIKACRRKGYTARGFKYDKDQWHKDKVEQQRLKEELENATTSLNQMASDSF